MLEDLCDAAISIKFNHSEDGQGEDSQSSPERHTNTSFKVKCFKCYGTKLRFCQECGSSQSIQNTHPMAMLLNDVLMRKLNLKKSNDSRIQHEEVDAIQEQEQEVQEKRPLCTYCSKQCDIDHYYCDQCPCFTVCSNCFDKSFQHEHKLYENITISDCIRGNSTIEIKYCCNCNGKIENCYTECKTCINSNIDYKLCSICSDNRDYIHSITHILEVVTDNESFRDNNIETISQELSEDREPSYHNSKEEINYLDEPKKLKKKKSSIANFQESHCTLFSSVLNSIDCNKINVQKSRVHLQIEDLFNSTTEVVIKSSVKLAEKHAKQQMEVKRSKSHHNTRIQNKENYQLQEYLFIDYKCDICEAQPIINVRYHCQQCEDFDVCQPCFETCKDSHLHQSFDRINGKQLRDKAVEKLFHDRDLNIKVSFADQMHSKSYLDMPLRKNQRNKTDYFHLSQLEQHIE